MCWSWANEAGQTEVRSSPNSSWSCGGSANFSSSNISVTYTHKGSGQARIAAQTAGCRENKRGCTVQHGNGDSDRIEEAKDLFKLNTGESVTLTWDTRSLNIGSNVRCSGTCRQ